MGDMKISDLTRALICASEKAAVIARTIRSEHALFSLLVEEKTGQDKNKRFVQDFKTLGDVLVQETVRHDLGCKFPGIAENILGEECNTFTNTSGEKVVVEVQPTQEQTCSIIEKVLEGNHKAASLLADVVHQKVTMDTLLVDEACREITMETNSKLQEVSVTIPVEDVGVWIDPIDSTAQYINGYESCQADGGIYAEGLQCVVVLIGAFHRKSGLPITGVVNQPFSQLASTSQQWTGRCCWGISYQDVSLQVVPSTGNSPGSLTNHAVVMSSSENRAIQDKVKDKFRIQHAAGAGYKVLCVLDKLVGAYVLSQGSTFKWDTCGPHSILASMDGGIVDFKKAVETVKRNPQATDEELCKLLEANNLHYHHPDSDELKGGQIWSNSGGLIAYSNKKFLLEILKQFEK